MTTPEILIVLGDFFFFFLVVLLALVLVLGVTVFVAEVVLFGFETFTGCCLG